MKNLSGGLGCGTDGVLNLIAGQAELLGNRVHRLARPEQVNHVLNAHPAVGEPRPPKDAIVSMYDPVATTNAAQLPGLPLRRLGA